jgi:hypothetical protein
MNALVGLSVSLVGFVLSGCAPFSGARDSAKASSLAQPSAAPGTHPLTISVTRPSFAARAGPGAPWTKVPASDLKGEVNLIQGADRYATVPLDPATNAASSLARLGDSTLLVSLSSSKVINSGSGLGYEIANGAASVTVGASTSSLKIAIQPLISSVNFDELPTPPKPGQTVFIPYLVLGPAYRVLVDDLIKVDAVVTSGARFARVVGADRDRVQVQVYDQTNPGETITLSVAVQNKVVTGAKGFSSGEFTFTVGAK